MEYSACLAYNVNAFAFPLLYLQLLRRAVGYVPLRLFQVLPKQFLKIHTALTHVLAPLDFKLDLAAQGTGHAFLLYVCLL